MRRIVAVGLAALMLLSLFSCGDEKKEQAAGETTSTTVTTTDDGWSEVYRP